MTNARSATSTIPTPILQKVMNIEVSIAPPQQLGACNDGLHSNYPIIGGTFSAMGDKGDWYQGKVLPSGADFFIEYADGSGRMNAIYSLQGPEQELINIHNTGLFEVTSQGQQRLQAGQWPLPESDYRCRCTPLLRVARGPLAWLDHQVLTGVVGYPDSDRVSIVIYRLA